MADLGDLKGWHDITFRIVAGEREREGVNEESIDAWTEDVLIPTLKRI